MLMTGKIVLVTSAQCQISKCLYVTCCILRVAVMISVTTVHIQIQYWRTLSFQIRMDLLIPGFGSSTRDERDTSLIMLTILSDATPCAVHLVMFKIPVGRDPKNPTTSFNGPSPTLASMAETQLSASMVQSQLTLFQNSQILRTISSRHDVIHTPTPFPVWGFIMTMVIVISFARKCKTAPNDYAPELLT